MRTKREKPSERKLVEAAVTRGVRAVRNAARFGDCDDLVRILAAGYAASTLVRREPSLARFARSLQRLEARGDPIGRVH